MKFDSTSQSIGWFRDRYREGSLEIKPPYQRKPVWVGRQKSTLIESILLGLPVPEVYVQETVSTEDANEYAVVDGQQRIRTILQFIGVEEDPDEEEHNKFALENLPPESAFYMLTVDDLEDDQKRAFFQYKLAVRLLETESDDEVRDMFRRLNKFLTPLNAQELRNATYTGPFIRVANDLADDAYWVEQGIVTTASIRRMKDLELVSELLIGVIHGPQGGSASAVDAYYSQYEDYEDEFPGQRTAKRLFRTTRAAVEAVLPNLRETRWSNLTDYYTLFVALARLLREGDLSEEKVEPLRDELLDFARQVGKRLADEEADVPGSVATYVRAMARGANDKARRGERHNALITEIAHCFD